jgi:hypothetical protein
MTILNFSCYQNDHFGDAVADFWTVEQQHHDDMPFGMRVCNFAKGYQGFTLIILPARALCY